MTALRHLALIMDGNGRWAEKRGLPRSAGHLEGGKAALKVIRGCLSVSIPYLTLYCFSTENWRRPKEEVDYLMSLFVSRINAEIPRAIKEGIRILHLGSRENLSIEVLEALDRAIKETEKCSRLTLQLAINYGGSDEIDRAVRRALDAGCRTFGEDTIARFLDNPEVPPPDFIARSSGEKRLSGFLLYQSSYAELGFYDRLWPDWDESMIKIILNDFESRQRRFGGI